MSDRAERPRGLVFAAFEKFRILREGHFLTNQKVDQCQPVIN